MTFRQNYGNEWGFEKYNTLQETRILELLLKFARKHIIFKHQNIAR